MKQNVPGDSTVLVRDCGNLQERATRDTSVTTAGLGRYSLYVVVPTQVDKNAHRIS